MKIIIFGCGKVGLSIVQSLSSEGHDVMVVDKEPKVVEDATNIYDVMGICGNGVDSNVMNEAGIADTELFIAVSGSDELNMLSCFLARKMGAKHTIARIRTPEYNDESLGFMKQHLDLSLTLNPEQMAAHEIYNVLRFPSAAKVESFSGRNLEIIELHLKSDSELVGKSLSDFRRDRSEKFLICYVLREDEVYIPGGNFVLREGDKIGVTASPGEILKLLKNLGMAQKPAKNVIILGASMTAYYLAKRLIDQGATVKIIDKDPEKCKIFASSLPEAVIIMGDGMHQEILLEEGIEHTDAFISLTGSDEENVLCSFFVAGNTHATVVTKVNKPELVSTAERLGLECIISHTQTVTDSISRYARALHNSMGCNVETLYKLMDGKAEILEFKVISEFGFSDVPLKELTLKKNVLIAGIIRGKKPIIPTGADSIKIGDRVVIIAAGQTINDLSDIVDRKESK